MRGLAFIAFALFFLLPLAMMSGTIDGSQALALATPAALALIVLIGLTLATNSLVTWIAANAPEVAEEDRAPKPSPAVLGLYFACVLAGAFLLIWYLQDQPIVADFVAKDFEGRRPGFLLIALPVMLVLAYAKWLDDRS